MSFTMTTVSIWQDGSNAFWAASTSINGHNVEFTVSTPLVGVDKDANPVTYSDSDLAASLQESMAAVVNAQLADTPSPLTGIIGNSVVLN